jgi:hypothetical protein
VADVVFMIDNFNDCPLLLQVFYHLFASVFYGQATIWLRYFRGNLTLVINNVYKWQIMALPYLEVVRVVGRGNLYGTGSELTVDKLVGDDRDFAVC